MEGFDEPQIFFSDNWGGDENQVDSGTINLQAVKKKFKEFIRQFHTENFNYKYRYFIIYYKVIHQHSIILF